MWPLALAAAFAEQPGGTSPASFCGNGDPRLTALAPGAGASGVPVDAVIAFGFEPGSLEEACVWGRLAVDGGGPEVAAAVEVADGLVRLRPAAPLAPGIRYRAEVGELYGETFAVEFTTAEGAAAPVPPVLAQEISYAPRCYATFEARVTGVATFAEDPPSDGLLALVLEADGVQAPIAYGAPSGWERVLTAATVVGVREPCAFLRLYDLTGEVAWEGERACASFTCPAPAPVGAPTLEARRDCDEVPGPATDVTVTLDVAPGEGGVFEAEVRTERGVAVIGPQVATGAEGVEIEGRVFGAATVCAAVRHVDPWGAETWRTEEVCAPPPDGPCAWEDDLEGVQRRGCATAPAAPLAALLLLLAQRSRMSRASERGPQRGGPRPPAFRSRTTRPRWPR